MERPTDELVKRKSEKWLEESEEESNFKYYGSELILSKLFLNTNNTDFREVYTKCYFLNKFYSTRMSNIELKQVANHIVNTAHFDELIEKGSIQAVNEIAYRSGTKRKNFSFASKYCSFSSPDEYPIYDKRIEEALWEYKKIGLLKEYRRQDLNENVDGIERYRLFKDKIDELKKECQLSCTYKELDHFLWGK